MSRYCVKCGAKLDDDSAFCPKCGTPARETEAAPAAPDANEQTEQPCVDEARVEPTEPPEPSQPEPDAGPQTESRSESDDPTPKAQPSRKMLRIAIPVACVIVVAVVLVIVFLMPHSDPQPGEGQSAQTDVAPAEGASATGAFEVSLAQPSESRRIVEESASLSMLLYIDATLATDQLQFAMENGASEKKVKKLIKAARAAWAAAEEAADNAYVLASVLEQAEEKDSYQGTDEPGTVRVSASEEDVATAFALAFGKVAYAASDDEDMEAFARKVEEAYDQFKPGQKIKGLAEMFQTDAKHAQFMLRQVQAYRSGGEYRAADKEYTRSINTCKAYKTGASTGLLICGTIACPPAGTLGYVTLGANTTSAVIDIAETTSTITLGEDHILTKAFQKEQEVIAPVTGVLGLISLSNVNISDIKQIPKATEKGYAALDGLWTSANMINDAVQDQTVMGFKVDFGSDSKSPSSSPSVMGQALDFDLAGTVNQAELEKAMKELGLNLEVGTDPNDPAAQPSEPTAKQVDSLREQTNTGITAEEVSSLTEDLKDQMSEAIEKDTGGAITAKQANKEMSRVSKELKEQREAEVKKEDKKIEKTLKEISDEAKEEKQSKKSDEAKEEKQSSKSDDAKDKEAAKSESAEKTDGGDKGGYMFSDIPNDTESALTTGEIAGSYHVTGTYSSPTFGEIPVDEYWNISSAGDAALNLHEAAGYEGVDVSGHMTVSMECDDAPYECWGYWGTITTPMGAIDIMRSGTNGGDSVAFAAKLTSLDSGATFDIRGSKE